MNKAITLLILSVVLCSMGYVLFMQGGGVDDSARNATLSSVESSVNATAAPAGAVTMGSDSLLNPEGARGTSAPAPQSSLPPLAPPPAQRGTEAPAEPASPPRLAPPAQPTGETAHVPTPQEAPKAPPSAAGNAETPPPARQEPPKAETPKAEAPKAEAPKTEPAKAETPPAPKNDGAPASGNAVKSMGIHFAEDRMQLKLEASGPIKVKSYALTNPDRVVLDFPGEWTGMQAPKVPANKIIKSARLGKQNDGWRIVLDLNAPPKTQDKVVKGNVLEFYVK